MALPCRPSSLWTWLPQACSRSQWLETNSRQAQVGPQDVRGARMTGVQTYPPAKAQRPGPLPSSLAGGTAGLRRDGEVVAAGALVLWAAWWDACGMPGSGLTMPGHLKWLWSAAPWRRNHRGAPWMCPPWGTALDRSATQCRPVSAKWLGEVWAGRAAPQPSLPEPLVPSWWQVSRVEWPWALGSVKSSGHALFLWGPLWSPLKTCRLLEWLRGGGQPRMGSLLGLSHDPRAPGPSLWEAHSWQRLVGTHRRPQLAECSPGDTEVSGA